MHFCRAKFQRLASGRLSAASKFNVARWEALEVKGRQPL
jgi:hypothetical protein